MVAKVKMETPMKAENIAAQAANLVGGDRARSHGNIAEGFGKCADLWNAYLSIRNDPKTPLGGVDYANMMILLKIGRTQSGGDHNVDNFIDMAGYAACGGEIAEDDEAAKRFADEIGLSSPITADEQAETGKE